MNAKIFTILTTNIYMFISDDPFHIKPNYNSLNSPFLSSSSNLVDDEFWSPNIINQSHRSFKSFDSDFKYATLDTFNNDFKIEKTIKNGKVLIIISYKYNQKDPSRTSMTERNLYSIILTKISEGPYRKELVDLKNEKPPINRVLSTAESEEIDEMIRKIETEVNDFELAKSEPFDVFSSPFYDLQQHIAEERNKEIQKQKKINGLISKMFKYFTYDSDGFRN